ncbi:MAG: hypothetical protein IKN27_06795, partial [Selenomonadaceae bacterium]|nr:hypothetical protein [Selenomonadaceae bacterium]
DASIKSFGASGNDFVFNFEDGSLTLTDAASKKISVTSGKVTNVYSADGIYNSTGKAVTLNASTKSYTADPKIVTIDAGLTSGVEITGNSKANKILLGDRANVFVWLAKGGNDTIYNFNDGDLVSIAGAVTDASVTKKGATVLNVGKNKLTFDNTDEVKFADDGGTKIFSNGIFYKEDATSATIPASFKSNMTTPLEFDAKEIDGSASKKSLNISSTGGATSILGSAKNDTIIGSAESDELYGGAGNDLLWGDEGADKFIYSSGDGNDIIYGFDDTDMLEITGAFSTSTNADGTEIYFKVGSTAKAITLCDFSATTFNVNGNTYQLSGSTLIKP